MSQMPCRSLRPITLRPIMAGSLPVWLFILAVCLCSPSEIMGQDSTNNASTNSAVGTPEEQIAALRLELTNAWQQVIRIVNQPVKAYVPAENTPTTVYSPGWFHDGASMPDFNTVDVRKSQDLIYASHTYVTSDLNPGVVFLGRDLEFNSMTKLFYVNRSLPKHKLTEPQMVEINRLYRIIGRCRDEIARLEAPTGTEVAASTQDGPDKETPAPSGLIGRVQSMPREKRALYGGIAIGALIIIIIAGRLLKRRAG